MLFQHPKSYLRPLPVKIVILQQTRELLETKFQYLLHAERFKLRVETCKMSQNKYHKSNKLSVISTNIFFPSNMILWYITIFIFCFQIFLVIFFSVQNQYMRLWRWIIIDIIHWIIFLSWIWESTYMRAYALLHFSLWK